MNMNLSYRDNRGQLLFPIKDNIYNYRQCTVSINNKNVLRGIHVNNFDKLVTCIQGKILDIIINFDNTSDDYLVPKYYYLDPNTELFQILVPKCYGHAFISLEDNSILQYHFNGVFNDAETSHYHYLDPYINIQLPKEINKNMLIISDKDNKLNFVKPIDYIIFGPNGFLGSNIIKNLKKKCKNYIASNLRLNEINEINELFTTYRPKYVINCAGLTGNPNIFWCDEHKTETMETNVTYQLTMASLCKAQGIHLTILGSAGIFKNDKMYTEADNGNNYSNFYGECRIMLENMVKYYDNVLYLRINYPISDNPSQKNLLTKLLKYETIDSIDVSITYIDDLIPLLFDMVEQNETGVCNFTNPGKMNIVDIIKTYNNQDLSQTKNIKINSIANPATSQTRSFAVLETNKLLKYNPLHISDAIELCCKNYVKNIV